MLYPAHAAPMPRPEGGVKTNQNRDLGYQSPQMGETQAELTLSRTKDAESEPGEGPDRSCRGEGSDDEIRDAQGGQREVDD